MRGWVFYVYGIFRQSMSDFSDDFCQDFGFVYGGLAV
jgi:hypothetical protein